MSYPYRCRRRSCSARRTLRKKLEQYVREPKCRECGGELRLDRWKMKDHKKAKCTCDGYHFPHRKGSKWCNYSTVELTEEDYKQRYGY